MSTKQDWTPEPWVIRRHQSSGCVASAEAGWLYDIGDTSDPDHHRAVACVNALAGLNPDGLAEAVAALREVCAEGCRGGTYDDEWECGRNFLCAACQARAALEGLGVADA